ncbi:unnamed protein product [Euphydryas editha]|uniref:Uncharacterized protein n=1 Tax=Euphydryas editha TaxID=104508 RepID=A0AAU9TS98_EUPED|nr:unnamed protein product [Euphydryas editha]
MHAVNNGSKVSVTRVVRGTFSDAEVRNSASRHELTHDIEAYGLQVIDSDKGKKSNVARSGTLPRVGTLANERTSTDLAVVAFERGKIESSLLVNSPRRSENQLPNSPGLRYTNQQKNENSTSLDGLPSDGACEDYNQAWIRGRTTLSSTSNGTDIKDMQGDALKRRPHGTDILNFANFGNHFLYENVEVSLKIDDSLRLSLLSSDDEAFDEKKKKKHNNNLNKENKISKRL